MELGRIDDRGMLGSQNPSGFIMLSHRSLAGFIMSTSPRVGRGNPNLLPEGSGQLMNGSARIKANK